MTAEIPLVSPPTAPPPPDLQESPHRPGLGRLTDWGITLGEGSPVLRGVPALAPVDGVVTARLVARDGERAAAVLQMGAGGATEGAGCAVHWDRASGASLRRAGFAVPVPRGSLFRLDFAAAAGAPGLDAHWAPLAPGPRTFGAFSPLPLDRPLQAETDGILVATLTTRRPGDRGALFACSARWPVELDRPESLHAATYAEESPKVRVPSGTLTLPVARGEHFKVQTGSLSGQPEIRAWWMPVLG